MRKKKRNENCNTFSAIMLGCDMNISKTTEFNLSWNIPFSYLFWLYIIFFFIFIVSFRFIFILKLSWFVYSLKRFLSFNRKTHTHTHTEKKKMSLNFESIQWNRLHTYYSKYMRAMCMSESEIKTSILFILTATRQPRKKGCLLLDYVFWRDHKYIDVLDMITSTESMVKCEQKKKYKYKFIFVFAFILK